MPKLRRPSPLVLSHRIACRYPTASDTTHDEGRHKRNPLKPRPVSATERLEGALEIAMRFEKRSRALLELGVKRGEALADVGHRLARKLDIGRRRVCLDLLGLVSAADDVHEVALRT